MPVDTRMRSNAAENRQDKEGQDARPSLSERNEGAAWFREAVGAYDTRKKMASDIGVDEPYLNRMCSGAKPVSVDHVVRIKRAHLAAFQRLVEVMARDARMVVVSSDSLYLTGEQRALLLATRELLGPEMWPAYRDKLAARVFRCGGDLIEHALIYEAAISKGWGK